MKKYLAKSEFLPYAPESRGTVRIAHNADYCQGSSESMLIERREDGSVSAHCFRCGSGGFYSGQRHYRTREQRDSLSADDSPVIVGGIKLPTDGATEFGHFGQAAKVWLNRSGLQRRIIEEQGFVWDPKKEHLYIPVRQLDDLKGFVRRSFREEMLRYKTITNDKPHFYGYYRKEPSERAGTLVLTEDIISALRVSEVSDSLALLGTSLTTQMASTIIGEGYKDVVIFLDADNSIVRMAARKITKKLPHLKPRLIETGRDPKHYSRDQLQEIIHAHR